MLRRKSSDYLNLFRSEAQNHSRTQQSILKTEIAEGIKQNNIKTFLTTNVIGWLYHYIKSRFGGKHPFLDYSTAVTNGVFDMYSTTAGDNDKIKMVIASDWATDTAESTIIGGLMKNENGDYSIHLGDIYFVGAPPEIQDNFTAQGASWPRGNSGTLALPGNHEFYSNGNPYFEKLLPEMFVKTKNGTAGQEASFFCLQNDYWMVLGLDTGYHSVGKIIIEFIFKPDAHLDDKLIDWLKKEVRLADNKKGLVILTHHQYCSAFEAQFVKAAETLQSIIGSEREVIWLWGHEHRFAVYGKYQSEKGVKAFGRCIGHGGMPSEVGKIKGGNECYKDPDLGKAKNYHLVFFDRRKKTVIANTIVGHNGFAVLNFDANKLSIEYKDESTWLFKEDWEIDLPTGKLFGQALNNPAVSLQLIPGSYDDAVK